MTTPESRVKVKLRKLLKEYPGIYTYWPVPMGYGRTTLDVLGCFRGQFFSVETKAEGKQPTLRQMTELEGIERAMGRSFIIAGTASPVFAEIRAWLDILKVVIPDDPHFTADPVDRRPL